MLFCWLHIQVRFTRSRSAMNVSIFLFTEHSFKIIQTYLPNVTIICISSTLVNIFLQFYITFSSQDRYGTVYKSCELWNMIFAKEPLYTSIQGRGLKRLPSGLSSFHNQNRLMLLSLIFSNIKCKNKVIKWSQKKLKKKPKNKTQASPESFTCFVRDTRCLRKHYYWNSARVEEICKNILPTVFDPVTCEMFKHFLNYKN